MKDIELLEEIIGRLAESLIALNRLPNCIEIISKKTDLKDAVDKLVHASQARKKIDPNPEYYQKTASIIQLSKRALEIIVDNDIGVREIKKILSTLTDIKRQRIEEFFSAIKSKMDERIEKIKNIEALMRKSGLTYEDIANL